VAVRVRPSGPVTSRRLARCPRLAAYPFVVRADDQIDLAHWNSGSLGGGDSSLDVSGEGCCGGPRPVAVEDVALAVVVTGGVPGAVYFKAGTRERVCHLFRLAGLAAAVLHLD
jgi:hypothetical protein